MKAVLQQILDALNRRRVRATYGAVAKALNPSPLALGGMLGERRPLASWIVSARTGQPTGYSPHQKHSDLESSPEILKTGLAVLQLLVGIPKPRRGKP